MVEMKVGADKFKRLTIELKAISRVPFQRAEAHLGLDGVFDLAINSQCGSESLEVGGIDSPKARVGDIENARASRDDVAFGINK